MADKKIDCTIERDFWDENGKRHPAGTEVSLDVDAALEGIESGALQRKKAAKK